jgi:hypothetical protein
MYLNTRYVKALARVKQYFPTKFFALTSNLSPIVVSCRDEAFSFNLSTNTVSVEK